MVLGCRSSCGGSSIRKWWQVLKQTNHYRDVARCHKNLAAAAEKTRRGKLEGSGNPRESRRSHAFPLPEGGRRCTIIAFFREDANCDLSDYISRHTGNNGVLQPKKSLPLGYSVFVSGFCGLHQGTSNTACVKRKRAENETGEG